MTNPRSLPGKNRGAGALLIAIAVLLCGCAGTTGTRSGGYYLDDGPPDAAKVDVAAIPDAQPRLELLRISAARPYEALGMRFVPMTRLEPYRARGTASWYGRRYHGKATASGETYDMMAMSAAHPTLPIPSYVRVTHLRNGRQVVVRVNDRGPFKSGRLIDLSYAAAMKLDLVRQGSAQVEVELLLPEDEATDRSVAGHRLQLGAYSSERNARQVLQDCKRDMPWLADKLIVRADADGLYRVYASPFPSRDDAAQAADRIRRAAALLPIIQADTHP